MDITTTISPNTRNYTSTETWLHRCALRLQVVGPLIDDAFAVELADQLHHAWPNLVPVAAVEAFFAGQ